MMEVRLKPLIITLSKLEVMIKAKRMMLARVRQQKKQREIRAFRRTGKLREG